MQVSLDGLPALAGRVTMVDGCFDPLHAGHVSYFAAAARLGAPLLVNVQGDEYIRRVKGRANLLPEAERAAVLDALSDIAYVHLCRTSTDDVLRRLRPSAYVKGADWRGMLPPEQVALCEELGIPVVFMETASGSSSEVVSRFIRGQERITAPVSPSPVAPPAEPPYEAVLTSHTNPYLSGVAKFSDLLAQRLGVPCLALDRAAGLSAGPLLLSLKLSDNGPMDEAVAWRALASLRERDVPFDVFLHAYGSSLEERQVVGGARLVYAGNHEIASRLRADGTEAVELFCPELLDSSLPLGDHALQLFSFGMVHKVRVSAYEDLRALLEEAGVDYGLAVSTAFHEKASFGEIDEISRGFTDLFHERVTLLGFLSDAAVRHFLSRSHAFVAFFPRGVRSNNTSVFAAMSGGRVAITNLDEHSPSWMEHGVNVLDVGRTTAEDLDPVTLLRLGGLAARDAAANVSWEALTEHLLAEAAPVRV